MYKEQKISKAGELPTYVYRDVRVQNVTNGGFTGWKIFVKDGHTNVRYVNSLTEAKTFVDNFIANNFKVVG